MIEFRYTRDVMWFVLGILLAVLLLSCGGDPDTLPDGGKKLAEYIDTTNGRCKEWRRSELFNLATGRWDKYEWCVRW